MAKKESKTKSVLTQAEHEAASRVANKYELMFILAPSLTEDKRTKAVAELQQLLDEKGAEVFHVDDWGKRNLAYSIRQFSEGYYMIYYFTLANTEGLQELDQHLRLTTDFLRYLVVKREAGFEVKDFSNYEIPGREKEAKK